MRRALGLALFLLACTDSTAPRPTISLTICDPSSHWIAYQNDRGAWTFLGAGGTHSFLATPRLAIARARFFPPPPGTASRLFVDYLTAEQAREQFTCASSQSGPIGLIGGNIAGAGASFYAQVYFNGIGANMAVDKSTWSMEAQPVPATLVAVRYDSAANAMFADRVMIRRGESYLPGTAVPLIDFASAEAFVPQQNTVTFTSPTGSLTTWYFTGGREHFLSSVPHVNGTQAGPIYSVPAARLADGDMHLATLSTIDNRVAQRFFRTGANLTLSIGPPLATPTITTLATQPYRRFRVQVPRQAEYGAAVEIHFAQLTPNFDRSSEITLHATREYFGEARSAWSLEVPDLSAVEGFQLVGMFAAGEFSWFLRATNARFGLSHNNAQDGETTLGAFRQGENP